MKRKKPLPQPYELGEKVEFSNSLYRTKDWIQGVGTRREWVPSSFSGVGVVVGWRTLSDGHIEEVREYDGYFGSTAVDRTWHASRYFRAYVIAFDLRYDTIFVLPEHLKKV